MTSHRADYRHSHARDTPKGLFFEEPTEPAVADALNRLRTALGPSAGPLQAAVTSLSVDEVGRLLTRTRANQRRAALEHLGIVNMAPRSIPASLSRDVAARLKKRNPVERHHALNHMCMAVMVDVARAIFEPAPDGLEARVSNLVATWGGPTLRTALWAICSASVPDARMWRWAVEQPWFCQDEADQEHARQISAAAAAVIDLTPDYAPGPFDKDALAPGHDEDLEQPGELDDFDPRDKGAPDPDAPEPDHDGDGYQPTAATTPASQPEPGLAPSERPSESLAGLKAAHARAGDLLDAATASAERAWGEVQASRAPKTADVDALRAVREAFDVLILALSSAGLDSDDESLPALGAAVARAAAAGADQPLADKLTILTGLTVHGHIPALATALEQLQAEVRLLIDARPWDSDSRARAASLALLTDLVASGRLTSTARLELLTQLPADRPELSFLAVQATHLRSAVARAGAQYPLAATAEHSTLADVPPDAPEVALEPEPREPAGDELPAIPSGGAVELPQADEAELTPQSTRSAAAADPAPHNEAPPVHGPALSTTDPIEVSAPDISPELAEHAHVVDTLATLLGQGRFGFAAQITHAARWSSTAARTLRVAALAQAVRTQHGPCAAALRAELNEMDSNEVAHEHYLQLVAVPALIRAALVTGESTCGALLNDLAPHLDPSLAAVADEVGRRALRGALAGTQVLAVLANVTGGERALSTASEAAAHVRDRHRSLRFKRASDIARLWLAPDGFLGRPLTLAANGKAAAVNDVAGDIHRLSDLSTVTDELNRQDRKLKGPSGKPLQGAGRQDLLSLVQEAVTALANWTSLVLAGAGPDAPAEHWSAADLGAMRQALSDQREAVLVCLTAQEASGDQLVAGAAHDAITSLGSTLDLLDGRGALASHSEPAPGIVLTIELLKVPGAHVDGALQIVSATSASVAELLSAAPRTWAQVLETQVASESFLAARFLLDAAANGTLPALDTGLDIGAQRDQVDAAERATRTALEQIHDDLVTAVRRARLTNQVTDEQDGELTGLLEDADPAGSDLAGVRRTLDVVASQLPMYTADAAAQLSDRLDHVAAPDANADVRARIRRLIDDGQLSTAEELIYFLENGEPVPDVTVRTDLADFFPQVPQHLGRGLTNELIALVTAVTSRHTVNRTLDTID